MNNKSIKSIKMILFALSTLSIFTFNGCARVQNPNPNQQNVRMPGGTNIIPGTPAPTVPDAIMGTPTPMLPNVVPGTQVAADADRRAKTVESRVNNMDGVNNCRVVLSDNVALVGVDTRNNNVGADQNAQLRERITNEVKSNCPGVTRVAITESPDMYKRIEKLSNDINNGTTMRSLTGEVRDILTGITKVGK